MFIIIASGIIRYLAKLYSYLKNKTIPIELMYGEIGFHILIYITKAFYLSLTKLLIEHLYGSSFKQFFKKLFLLIYNNLFGYEFDILNSFTAKSF